MNPQVINIVHLAEKYYSNSKLRHAIRVASFATTDAMTRKNVSSLGAYIVGIAHDLLEDTDCPPEELSAVVGGVYMSSILTLTKDDDDSYDEYIQNILDSDDPLAILVKKADMKDHFMQEDTLTDKLLKKYLPHIKEFL